MRTVAAVTLLILVGLPSPAGLSAGEREDAAKEADAKLRRLVDDAIDRGAKWLVERQEWNGSFPGAYSAGYPMGSTALPLLALLHSGVPVESAPIRRAMTWLRARYGTLKAAAPPASGLKTYSVAVTIMALVESGRTADGRFRLPSEDRAWLAEMVEWLLRTRDSSGVWRYPAGGYDHSNSQYALLALKEARRAGAEVPDSVFLAALRHFLSAQESDGPRAPRYREHGGDGVYSASRERESGYDRERGWGYVAPTAPTGSMTAAGVAAVAIASGELTGPGSERIVVRGEQAARDGLAWLGKHFSVEQNPPTGAAWHYYYLYGLERAGVLAGVVYMGEHRWYAEGARYLVDAQGPDGAWRPLAGHRRGAPVAVEGNPVDQSFALLFLSRSTARALGVATERPLADLTSAAELDDADLETLFRAAFDEMTGLDDERAGRRAREFAFLGPRVIRLLLPLLASSDEGRRARAVRILRAVTGEEFGFEAGAKRESREAAADRWTAWYIEKRDGLYLDREALRLR